MNKLTQEMFDEAYAKHQLWLNDEEGGEQMDLSYKDLTGIVFDTSANLEWANLRGANLSVANLEGADLSWADLKDANLRGANLKMANLERAYLKWANLGGANLEGTNLEGANLKCANLEGANLEGTNLEGANLKCANLKLADLSRVNLNGADMSGANLGVYQKWSVTWEVNGTIKIGCKSKGVPEWDVWFEGDETYETPRNTADFERIEAAYQHAKRMHEIWMKYEGV